MIYEETLAFLAEAGGDDLDALTLSEVVIGSCLCAVRLSDGSAGVAATLTEHGGFHGKGSRDFGEFTPLRIRGRRVRDLLYSEKDSQEVKALQIAALNALSCSMIRGGPYPVEEDRDPVDLLGDLRGKRIYLVGAFPSYIRRFREEGCDFSVLERNPSALKPEHQEHFVPAEHYGRVLPGAEIVILTGQTLVNRTIDALLGAVSPGAVVVVTGPSCGAVPDILFRYGVSIAGSLLITDPAMMLAVAAEGGTGYHLFHYCARKMVLVNPSGRV